MDLYEALKAGTSQEELVATFEKQLNAAKERLKQEKVRETKLDASRSKLASALIEFMCSCFGEDLFDELTPEEVEDVLKKIEREAKDAKGVSVKFEKDGKDPTKIQVGAPDTFDDLWKDLFSYIK